MIGIILCCHGDMAPGLLSAASLIVGPQEQVAAITLHPHEGADELRKKMKAALRQVGKEGAVILTDLPGGTPCNVATALLSDSVKMITGINLPLVIKLLLERATKNTPQELIQGAAAYAASMVLDSDTLLSAF